MDGAGVAAAAAARGGKVEGIWFGVPRCSEPRGRASIDSAVLSRGGHSTRASARSNPRASATPEGREQLPSCCYWRCYCCCGSATSAPAAEKSAHAAFDTPEAGPQP